MSNDFTYKYVYAFSINHTNINAFIHICIEYIHNIQNMHTYITYIIYIYTNIPTYIEYIHIHTFCVLIKLSKIYRLNDKYLRRVIKEK
jgi:hypothetical protein